MPPIPPYAARRPHVTTAHGETREDPYHWLRAANWQEVMRDPARLPPEIGAHLEAENGYTAAVMADTDGLRRGLIAELRARIKEDDASVPVADGGWLYYHRFTEGGQHPVFCRRAGADSAEEVLFDGNAEAAGHAFFRIAAVRHSPDHRRIAWTVDLNGSEYYALHVRDLATGAAPGPGPPIADAQGDFAFSQDGDAVFYTRLDENHRPNKVVRHVIGADPAADVAVYQEPDPGFYVRLERSEGGRFIVVHAHDHATAECWLIDAMADAAPARLVARRKFRVQYDVAEHGGRLYVRTNADGADDFKIMEGEAEDPAAPWRELVAARPGRLIRSIVAFRDHLVRLERAGGLPRIVVRRLADGAEHAIAFDEEAYDLGLEPLLDYATATLRFSYASPTTPEEVWDYDMETRARSLRKRQEVPSGHDPAAYVCRRLFAPGHDGARVPVTVLHRRDLVRDGSAPVLLYGYGAYGITIPAGFAPNRFSLVDRGFVHAIAHVRGGLDMGWGWYQNGKLAAKPNTFLDFIAAAEHLVAEGYARPGGIAAHGGSAGGMLVGAVINMRPELFRAAVAEVPFVDVLETMLDDTLPLTPPEWHEWGNPVEDEDAYRLIRSYSPYDNIRRQAYPHVLATAGLTDPRVTYWEPAKWVARLREANTADTVVLLRTHMGAGHAGAAGRFDKLEEVAFVYAFLMKAFGIVAPSSHERPGT